MRKLFYGGRFIFIPIAVAAFLVLISFIVMNLWNYLLPGLLHAGVITFWQAMALFLLCKILFGFGKGRPRMGNAPWMRHGLEDRLKNMSTEERETFKGKMESRMCGNRNRAKYGRRDFDERGDKFAPEAEKATE